MPWLGIEPWPAALCCTDNTPTKWATQPGLVEFILWLAFVGKLFPIPRFQWVSHACFSCYRNLGVSAPGIGPAFPRRNLPIFGGSSASPISLDPHLILLYMILTVLCQGLGVFGDWGPVCPAWLPSKGWGQEVLREKVQSLTLGIQSYSATEFLMHLVLYNKLCFTDAPVAVNGVKGRASLGSGDLFLRDQQTSRGKCTWVLGKRVQE